MDHINSSSQLLKKSNIQFYSNKKFCVLGTIRKVMIQTQGQTSPIKRNVSQKIF